MQERLAGAVRQIQLEDVALAGALIVASLLAPPVGGIPVLEEAGMLGALAGLIASVGAIAAMATRVPGESRLEAADGGTSRAWMIGPFIGGVAFVGGESLERLGLPGGGLLIGLAFAAAVAALLLGDRLPVVSRDLRRLMVAPFVLVSALGLQGIAADTLAGWEGIGDVGVIFAAPNGPVLLLTLLAVLAAVAWIFYAMFVFVPRELANPGGGLVAWSVRFAIFYVSLAATIVLGVGRPPIVV